MLRQEDHKFEVCLGNLVSPYLKIQKKPRDIAQL
jgi:hypothetical protein